MGAEEVVTVAITSVLSPISQVGFGTPLILDSDNNNGLNGRRTARFSQAADLLSAGFLVTDAAYLAAAAIFGQTPHPPQVVVGKRSNKPTLQWKVTPTAQDSTVYSGKLNNVAWTFTSGAGTTLTLVINGIKAALDALAVAGVTVANVGPNTSMTITLGTPGQVLEFTTDQSAGVVNLLSVEQVQADPGVAADLAAILLVDSDWYALVCTTASTAEVTALAAWAQANAPHVYLVSSQDTRIITSSGADIQTTLKATATTRTGLFTYPDNGPPLDAAVAGLWLPMPVGSETLDLKTVAGIPAVPLTPDQKSRAQGKYANTYTTIANRNVIQEGWVANGGFLDQIRGRDWFVAGVQGRLFALLANAQNKVPNTDVGATQVQNQVQAQIQDGIDNGYIAPTPKPVVTVPLISTVGPSDKTARRLPSVTFAYTEAGAIHHIAVAGTVAV